MPILTFRSGNDQSAFSYGLSYSTGGKAVMRRARAIKSRDAQCPCLKAMRRLRIGRRDFAQMRVRILLNAMVEAKSWVLRAKNGAGVKYVEHPASGRVSRRGNEVSMFRILCADYVQIATVF